MYEWFIFGHPLTGATTYYLDRDEDGAFSDTPQGQCGTPSFAFETNLPVQPDCNDDPDNDGAAFNFLDEDGDAVTTCPRVDGLIDCNDDPLNFGALQSPMLIEAVDLQQLDEDCNGAIDCYLDDDNDGYGVNTLDSDALPSTDVDGCDAIGNQLASNADDCADNNANVFLGAAEVPGNGFDDSCDGFEACCADIDDDGFGDSASELPQAIPTDNTAAVHCDAQTGFASMDGDCDDTAGTVRDFLIRSLPPSMLMTTFFAAHSPVGGAGRPIASMASANSLAARCTAVSQS